MLEVQAQKKVEIQALTRELEIRPWQMGGNPYLLYLLYAHATLGVCR